MLAVNLFCEPYCGSRVGHAMRRCGDCYARIFSNMFQHFLRDKCIRTEQHIISTGPYSVHCKPLCGEESCMFTWQISPPIYGYACFKQRVLILPQTRLIQLYGVRLCFGMKTKCGQGAGGFPNIPFNGVKPVSSVGQMCGPDVFAS